MAVEATGNSMGLMGQIKLSVDEKTGQIKGTSDVFSSAIEEVHKAQLAPKALKEDQIKDINTRLEALATLETKAKDLAAKSAYLFHSDAHGHFGVFSNMYANFSSTSSTPVAELMDLNMSANSNVNEFTLEIKQVATHDTTTATTGLPDTTSDLGWGGSMTLNGQVVTVTANMSLEDVKNMINSYSDDSNVQASIVKVSDNDFRLSLQASQLGSAISIVDSLTGTGVGEIPVASGKTNDDLSAKIAYNGIDITRATNNIDDIVEGMTLVVRKAEIGTTMTVQISPDQQSTKDAIASWVKSINALKDEIKKHQSYDLEKQEMNEDAVLSRSNIIQDLDTTLKQTLSWVVGGVDADDFRLLESIGIKRDLQTGKLSIDEQVLDEKLKTNFQGVRKVFEYQEQVSNGSVIISDHPDQISSKIIEDSSANPLTSTVNFIKDAGGNLSAEITINGGDYAGLTFVVPNSAITVIGDVIEFKGGDAASVGTTDLPYKGFTFIYVGSSNIANGTSDSTTVSFTQGFADRLSANMTNMLREVTGAFSLQKDEYAKDIKALESAIERIEARADKKKEEFQKQFALFEAMRQKMQPLEDLLEAWSASMYK